MKFGGGVLYGKGRESVSIWSQRDILIDDDGDFLFFGIDELIY